MDAEARPAGQNPRQPWLNQELHADGLPVVIAEDHSVRARVKEIVVLRAQGFNHKEIAEQMEPLGAAVAADEED